MNEFLASDTSLIIGILLVLVAVGDYLAMRYIIPRYNRKNPETADMMKKLTGFAPYWIAAIAVAGLYLVIKYFENSPS